MSALKRAVKARLHQNFSAREIFIGGSFVRIGSAFLERQITTSNA
jgi:hypothetical protein